MYVCMYVYIYMVPPQKKKVHHFHSIILHWAIREGYHIYIHDIYIHTCIYIHIYIHIYIYVYIYTYIYIYIHVYYKQRFVRQVCKPELIQKHIKAAEKMDTKELL